MAALLRGGSMSRRVCFSLASVSFAFLAVASGACSADTEDLFGSGGSGATGGTASGMSTGAKMSTSSGPATTSGLQSTGALSTSATSASGPSSSAAGATCGDGVVNQANEDCDGLDLGGHDCIEQGFTNPTGATCTNGCTVDFAGCANTCGDGFTEPGEECDDGNTNPYDNCSATCVSQGTDCMTPIPVTLPLGQLDIDASTGGADGLASIKCMNSNGPELIYMVTPMHAGFITAWTDPVATTFDAMVYARTQCNGTSEIQCGDNLTAEPDLISFPVGDAMQPVYIVVDGYQGDFGDFTLHLDLSVGNDCNDPVPILVGDDNGFPEHALGNTTPTTDNTAGSCALISAQANADVVYAVTRMTTGLITETTTSGGALNSVTYARTTCANAMTEVACSSPATSNNSNINLTNVGSTPVFVWIDGSTGQPGGYDASFNPP